MVASTNDTEVEHSVLPRDQCDLLQFLGPVALLPHQGGPRGSPVLKFLCITDGVVVVTVPTGGDRSGPVQSQHCCSHSL